MTNAAQIDAAQDQAATTESTPDQVPTFAEIGLPAPVVAALGRDGITVPSPIQAMAVPDAIAGRNVLGRAQTGSGKTLAFGLPMIARLAARDGGANPRRPRALVLVPTRELAVQVVDSLLPYAATVGLRVRSAVGGMVFTKQVDQLARGVDILVATPGRLGDHLRQETCVLDEVEITALDEADQMADMGFLPEVKSILEQTRADGQRLLFSATLDREVQSLVRRFLPDHVEHATEDGRASVDTMDHYLLHVGRGEKDEVLAEIGSRQGGRTIMFARTKLGSEGIVERLRAVGVVAEALHGGKAQNQRTRVLERFKTGRTPVLVATDVAARGIHVDGIDLVVHVDPPADHKDYLHRAGRTARAGERGTVVSIVLPNQRRMVRRLTDTAGVEATVVNVGPGSEELATITGSRTPSGEPVRERRSDRPERSHGGRSHGDRPYRDRPQRRDGDRRDSGFRGEGGYQRRDNAGHRDGAGYRGDRDNRNDRNDRDFRREGGFRNDRDDRGYRGRDESRRSERPYRGGEDRDRFRGDRDNSGYRGERSGRDSGFRRDDRSFRDDRRNQGDRRGQDDRRHNDDRRNDRDGYRGPRDDHRNDRGNRDDRPRRDDQRSDRGNFRDNSHRDNGHRDNGFGGNGDRGRAYGDRSYGDRSRDDRGQRRSDHRPHGDRSNSRDSRDFRNDRPRSERSHDQRAPRTGTSGGFRSRSDRRAYDGFDGPARDHH